MLDVRSLTVRFSPRSAELRVADEDVAERSIRLVDRAADRVVDSLYLLLDAWSLPERPSELCLEPLVPAVAAMLSSGRRELDAESIARLPARAISGPVDVARREAGDVDAEGPAGALAGDASFWGARYRENDLGWDLGEPAPPLLRVFRELKPCRAIVVGCGQGHEVRALAQLGFEAIGVDFAPEAVARARRLTAGPGTTATFVQADVLALPETLAPFDLWVEHTCFCAIDPAQRQGYVEAAHRALRPGGLLVGLFYAHGRTGGPPFTTSDDGIRRRFAPSFQIEELERAPDSIERRRGEELLGRFRSPSRA